MSAISTVSSPRSLARSRSATLRMPSSDTPADPRRVLVLVARHAEQHQPADARRRPPRRRPGAASRGCAARRPASTRSGAVRRYRRRRTSAAPNALAPARFAPPVGASPGWTAACVGGDVGDATARPPTALAATALLARRRQRTLGTQPGGVLGERLDQRAHRGDLRLHVDAQAEFRCGFSGLGPDARHDRARVRLARDADEVAHRRARGEADRVEAAGLDHLAGRARAAVPRAPCGRR